MTTRALALLLLLSTLLAASCARRARAKATGPPTRICSVTLAGDEILADLVPPERVVAVTTFKTEEEALSIANETEFGLGAGLWTRDTNRSYRVSRAIKAGRVWVNCYHAYPAHAAFGGYKKSGIGRETHKMALQHYQQTKNLLVSYDINPLGFF